VAGETGIVLQDDCQPGRRRPFAADHMRMIAHPGPPRRYDSRSDEMALASST
jgi:hypothetical protein